MKKAIASFASFGCLCILIVSFVWAENFPDYVCVDPVFQCLGVDCAKQSAKCEGKDYNRHRTVALMRGYCTKSTGSDCPNEAKSCINYKIYVTPPDTECDDGEVICIVAGEPQAGCFFE